MCVLLFIIPFLSLARTESEGISRYLESEGEYVLGKEDHVVAQRDGEEGGEDPPEFAIKPYLLLILGAISLLYAFIGSQIGCMLGNCGEKISRETNPKIFKCKLYGTIIVGVIMICAGFVVVLAFDI